MASSGSARVFSLVATIVRVVIALLLLMPAGLFMGMLRLKAIGSGRARFSGRPWLNLANCRRF